MFVPLVHPAGDAQADFGEALVVIGGEEAEGTLSGDRSAAVGRLFRDGIPGRNDGSVSGGAQSGVCILRRSAADHSVRQHEAGGGADPGRRDAEEDAGVFLSCRATTCSRSGLGGPARETTRGRWRDWSDMHDGTSWCRCHSARAGKSLNTHLREQCQKRRQQRLRGHEQTIGERFEKDRTALLPLPATPYEACDKRTGASEFSLSGAVSRQRLFGTGVLGAPRGSGQRLRPRGGDLVRRGSDCAALQKL